VRDGRIRWMKKLSKQCPNGEEEDTESRIRRAPNKQLKLTWAREAPCWEGQVSLKLFYQSTKELEAVKQTEELRASLPGTFGKSCCLHRLGTT
jgi:hypothetical protein